MQLSWNPLALDPSQGNNHGVAEAAVMSRPKWERIHLQAHLWGCLQTLGPHWLWAGEVSSLSHGPLHRAAHNWLPPE